VLAGKGSLRHAVARPCLLRAVRLTGLRRAAPTETRKILLTNTSPLMEVCPRSPPKSPRSPRSPPKSPKSPKSPVEYEERMASASERSIRQSGSGVQASLTANLRPGLDPAPALSHDSSYEANATMSDD
jgi:hypothetical protein